MLKSLNYCIVMGQKFDKLALFLAKTGIDSYKINHLIERMKDMLFSLVL